MVGASAAMTSTTSQLVDTVAAARRDNPRDSLQGSTFSSHVDIHRVDQGCCTPPSSGNIRKLLLPASTQRHLQTVLLSSSSSVPPPLSAPRVSSQAAVTVQTISDNLSFRPATGNPASGTPLDSARRPIVLIYAWLAAKSRHIHKFGDFYLAKGYDVLHIKVGARQILWPPMAQTVVSQIIEFLTAPGRHAQPILVHGFSVGGYLYGETLNRIVSDAALAESMSARVRGQVFDSPVDFEGVPRGVGMAVTDLGPLQVAIKSSLEAYMSIFRRHVTAHYRQSSAMFRSNPLRTPSLVLYSDADVIGMPGPIESVVEGWRGGGVPVRTRKWADSEHVSHYLRDPVNYTAELNQFLASVGLLQHQQQGSADAADAAAPSSGDQSRETDTPAAINSKL